MFNINLLKNQVDPPHVRKVKHVGMHAYLAVWGVLLIAVAYAATNHLIVAWGRHRDTRQLEHEFLQYRPAAHSMEDYAEHLLRQLRLADQALVSMDGVFKERTPMAEILLGLAVCLPPGSYISNGAWDSSNPDRRFIFDVMVPMKGHNSSLQPEDLIRKWHQEEALKGRLDDISSTATERRQVGDDSAYLFRFNCRIVNRTGS